MALVAVPVVKVLCAQSAVAKVKSALGLGRWPFFAPVRGVEVLVD
jgi:hypothetical protein